MLSEKDQRLALRALSVLLRYPEDDWIQALPDIEEALEPIREKSVAAPLNRFFSWAKGLPPLQLQESYTAAFDLNPASCLDLTYHSQGDTENRGRILSRLRSVYGSTGLDCTTAELPDHLPLVLEFLSFAEEGKETVLGLCTHSVRALAETLRTAKSPYADPVGCAADILSAMAAEATEEVAT
jgi:nitrate reductase delta subunit